MRVATTFASLMFLGTVAGVVHAEAQSSVEDDDARTLFQLGEAAFDGGRFEAALRYFQQAYELSGRPQLLYNIGQTADRLRMDSLALESFSRYLELVPASPNRPATEARLRVLRAAVARAAEPTPASPPTPATTASPPPAATPAPSAAPPAPQLPVAVVPATPNPVAEPAPSPTLVHEARDLFSDPGEPSRSPTMGWVIAGGGLGIAGLGAVFLALGSSDRSAVENAADGSTFESVRDEYQRAATRLTTGSILAGVGTAALGTGLALALTAGGDGEVEVTASPTGFVIRGRF